MKESIVFYKSFYEAIKLIPKENQVEVYTAIFEKYFYNKDVELNGPSKAILTLIVPNIDSANARYFANVENGKKGGAPKGNQNARKTTQNNRKTTQNNLNEDEDEDVNDNVDVNEDGKEDVKVDSVSVPSDLIISFDDVFRYGLTLGAGKQYCKKFFDYYERRGWLNNDGQLIQDWQSVFNNWWEKDKGQVDKPGNSIIPSWVGKEIKTEKATKEEEQEIKELLKGFK